MENGKSAEKSAFWSTIQRASDSYHRSLHLRGRMIVNVSKCDGCHAPGVKNPGWTDYDGNDYPGDACHKCGRVEVQASPEIELAAVIAEIKSLQARAKLLRKKCKEGDDGKR